MFVIARVVGEEISIMRVEEVAAGQYALLDRARYIPFGIVRHVGREWQADGDDGLYQVQAGTRSQAVNALCEQYGLQPVSDLATIPHLF